MIAMLKIRSTVFAAIREYFLGEDFIEYHSPIFRQYNVRVAANCSA